MLYIFRSVSHHCSFAFCAGVGYTFVLQMSSYGHSAGGHGIRGLQQCLCVGDDAVYLCRGSAGPTYTQEAWQRARRAHQQAEARGDRLDQSMSSSMSRSLVSGAGGRERTGATLPKVYGAGNRYGFDSNEPKEYFLPQLPSSILSQRSPPNLSCCSMELCPVPDPTSSGATPGAGARNMRALVRAFRPGSELNNAVRTLAGDRTSFRVRQEDNFMQSSRLLAGEPPSAGVDEALACASTVPSTNGRRSPSDSQPSSTIRLFHHASNRSDTTAPELLWMRHTDYKELQVEQALLAKAHAETLPGYHQVLDALDAHHIAMRKDFARLLHPAYRT
jgi:hypothetical protein